MVGEATVIIDGDRIPGITTLEGPKFYKRRGWYYVFAPAGGVTDGWQSVFRSRTITGPYEHRIVMDQGKTAINGPHQGAWVETPAGEDWFLHFQDQGAYGRVVLLEPMVWHDDWPVIGEDPSGSGKGQPVLVHAKPALPPQPPASPATSDDFTAPGLGLQWQWQANPGAGWYSLSANPGHLRLFAQPSPRPDNLYEAANLLLQKFPAREFTVTTELQFAPKADGDRAGLVVFGYDYAWIGLKRINGVPALVFAERKEAVKGEPEVTALAPGKIGGRVWLRVTVRDGGRCRFSFSADGAAFTAVGNEFTATVGRWVGAKVGVFAAGALGATADFASFRLCAP
jgi:beta-xylosidase